MKTKSKNKVQQHKKQKAIISIAMLMITILSLSACSRNKKNIDIDEILPENNSNTFEIVEGKYVIVKDFPLIFDDIMLVIPRQHIGSEFSIDFSEQYAVFQDGTFEVKYIPNFDYQNKSEYSNVTYDYVEGRYYFLYDTGKVLIFTPSGKITKKEIFNIVRNLEPRPEESEMRGLTLKTPSMNIRYEQLVHINNASIQTKLGVLSSHLVEK